MTQAEKAGAAAPSAGTGQTAGAERAPWRAALKPYMRPRVGRRVVDLLTSVVPYLALSVAMYLLREVSVVLVLALAVPTAGFLLRTYIMFHDCTHGSFLPSKRANGMLGAV